MSSTEDDTVWLVYPSGVRVPMSREAFDEAAAGADLMRAGWDRLAARLTDDDEGKRLMVLNFSLADSLGREAYRAYCAATGGRSAVSGAVLPGWAEQSEEIQAAWRAAAGAVHETVLKLVDEGMTAAREEGEERIAAAYGVPGPLVGSLPDLPRAVCGTCSMTFDMNTQATNCPHADLRP